MRIATIFQEGAALMAILLGLAFLAGIALTPLALIWWLIK